MPSITTSRWMAPFARLRDDEGARIIARTAFYVAIIGALLVLYGHGDFSTPPFLYQGF